MNVIKVDNNNFKEEVIDNNKVLVDFNAEWCGPCRMLKPVLEEVAQNSNVKIVSVNIDENQDLAREYNVFSIPTLVLFENGKETNRSVGFINKDEIQKIIGD